MLQRWVAFPAKSLIPAALFPFETAYQRLSTSAQARILTNRGPAWTHSDRVESREHLERVLCYINRARPTNGLEWGLRCPQDRNLATMRPQCCLAFVQVRETTCNASSMRVQHGVSILWVPSSPTGGALSVCEICRPRGLLKPLRQGSARRPAARRG